MVQDKDIQEVLFSEETLRRRVAELGAEITRDYQGKEPILASVLRGSYIFMADLARAIDLPVTVDFMAVSSYGAGTKSSGQVQITKDLSEDELREIARLQGEYASAAFKEHAGKVIEKAGDVIDKTGAAIDGFVDGLKSDDKSKDK